MVRITQVYEAHLVGEGDWISATEVCQLCRIDLAAVQELAELGVVVGVRDSGAGWQMPASTLPRLRIVGALMRDLGVNASGAALALELLETQRVLERRIADLERLANGH
ncbi:MAG: MerR family transcriptional regulator [Proteobacteria bacterium]|nr:MerR family transcriptional regulator [Pseudomonadota bacterium]